MAFKALLFIFLIGFLAVFSVMGFIISIVKWKVTRTRNLWLSLGILSMAGCMFAAVVTVQKIVHKVETVSNNVKEAFKQIPDARQNDSLRIEHINLLKSYCPEELKDKAPENFYTYKGFYDWYRIPLRYPYSLVSIDVLNFAFIQNELEVEDITQKPNTAISLNLKDIVLFDFDSHHLIAISEANFGASDPEYYYLDFETGNILQLDTEEELIQLALKNNFEHEINLKTVRDYYHEH